MQAALEAYSVLTRLPPPQRASAAIVRDFIDSNFAGALLTLSADNLRALISELADLGITGGAAYDALIGVTARDSGKVLLTLDARARQTYARLRVSVEYLG